MDHSIDGILHRYWRVTDGRSEPEAAVIVCSCNVISDQQVRSVTSERPVRGTSEVYRCLGCSAECGRCARTIRRIMDEVGARPAEDRKPCDGNAVRCGPFF